MNAQRLNVSLFFHSHIVSHYLDAHSLFNNFFVDEHLGWGGHCATVNEVTVEEACNPPWGAWDGVLLML